MTILIKDHEETYASVEDVRAIIGDIDINDGDIYVQLLKNSDLIDEMMGKSYRIKDYDEFYSTDGTDTLILNHYPISQIIELEVWENGEWKQLQEYNKSERYGDYIIKDAGAGIIKRVGGTFPDGFEQVHIKYLAGRNKYPEIISRLCALLTAKDVLIQKSNNINPMGLTGISEGSLSLNWGNIPYGSMIEKINTEIEDLKKKIKVMHYVIF